MKASVAISVFLCFIFASAVHASGAGNGPSSGAAPSSKQSSTSGSLPSPAAAEVSCQCEAAQCKPCEVAIEQPTFYTAKCGPGHSKIKSCARVTCEPVPDQKQCLADLKVQGEAVPQSASGAGSDRLGVSGSSGPAVRKVAVSADPVGTVNAVVGDAKVARAGGGEDVVRTEQAVYEGDTLTTGSGGRIRVVFKDDNVLNVPPDSRVVIEAYSADAKSARRKTLLNLMYGKVRAKVSKANKYDGAHNTFQVRTKAAVAGVRGTDFVTSFTPGEKAWITEVKTFEGHVEFGGEARAERVHIREGEAASFIVVAPPTAGEVSAQQLRALIDAGTLSETRKMKPEEMEILDHSTSTGELGPREASLRPVRGGREPASVFDAVCSEPLGDLNWCSFTCEGQTKGGKTCETARPGVRCVRRICNANGQWAEPTVLPKSAWSSCEPAGIVVRQDCGDY